MRKTHKVINLHAGETRCGRPTEGRKFHIALDWDAVDCQQCRQRYIRRHGYDDLPSYGGKVEAAND